MSASVRWVESTAGAVFRVESDGCPVAPDRWALAVGTEPGTQGRGVSVLLRLLEDELLEERDDSSALISHRVLARLSRRDLGLLGLPGPAPYVLTLEGSGLLTESGFQFRYELSTREGRRVLAPERCGAFIRVGAERYIVPDPIYSLLDAMEQYNESPPDSMEERFLRWARIRELLPPDAIVDDYLLGMQVVCASSFSLDVRAAESGGMTFDPVLVHVPPRTGGTLDEEAPHETAGHEKNQTERVLAPSSERAFARTFRRFRDARSRYAVGDGVYVVVEEPLRRALAVVREMQDAPPHVRKEFARNPRAILRAKLGDDLGEEEVAELFFEPADYGDRVAAIGAWMPKVLPFLKQASDSWLPGDVFGLTIDGRQVPIDASDLPTLRERLEAAIAEKGVAVDYRGEAIPATVEALGAITKLEETNQAGVALPRPTPDRPPEPRPPDSHGEKVVLLLEGKDNLHALAFEAARPVGRPGEETPPQGMVTTLKNHQVSAYKWLQKHWLRGSAGALLADDMGLGKTLACLAFLLWMQSQNKSRGRSAPVLVVAPTGLLQNWVAEHEKHLLPEGLGQPLRAYGPSLKALRRQGLDRVGELTAGAPVLRTSALEAASWVLTTYETLRDYSHSFGRVRWSAMVLDEAQKIKSPGALVTEECKAVASNADFVLAMTGTPVENRLADIWSIVDTCQPGVLRDLKSFLAQYDRQTERDVVRLTELRNMLAEASTGIADLPAVMLRRMKSQELEGLPLREDHLLRVEMPAVQAARYSEIVAAARQSGKAKGGMLRALHEMRKASLHPDPIGASGSDEDFLCQSARMRAAIDVLDHARARCEKVLVFLEFRDVQPLFQGLLQRRYQLDHPPIVINGAVLGDRRKVLVDRFQEGSGFDVMILSPRAGGVGLTLTAANHVIHLSRWWNPAVEDQCTDRVYRIGQDRPVHVHVPLAVHPLYGDASFDERLHSLLERKRELGRQVLGLACSEPDEGDLEELFEETTAGGAAAGRA